MAGIKITQPSPLALPGQRYASFAGKPASGAGPAVGAGYTTFGEASERLGGARLFALYELTVTHPVTRTWYLSAVDLNADEVYAGSPAYEGLVESDEPVESASILGGLTEGGRVTLTLRDHLGSYRGQGPFRRFSDQFAEVVAGYGEPYDLDTAVLTVSLTWAGLTSGDVLQLGRWVVVPGSKGIPAAGRLALDFESDPRFHRPLPTKKITPDRWPGAPEESMGRVIPLVFGAAPLALPGLPVDAASPSPAGHDQFVFCESPSATPVTVDAVQLVALQPNSERPVAVTLTSATNPIQSYTAGATSVGVGGLTGHDWAWGLYFAADNYLQSTVEIELARGGGPGGTYYGALVLTIEENASGIPAGTPFVPHATASFNPNTVTDDNTFRFYTLVITLPALLRAGVVYWIVLRYKKGDTADTRTLLTRIDPTAGPPPAPGGAGLLIALDHGSIWAVYSSDNDPTRGHANHKVNGFAVTLAVAMADGLGSLMAGVTFSAPLAEGTPVIGVLRGMQDDGSGTYTGTAAARIQNGADVARWLMRAPDGLALEAARVDATALTAARAKLASWFGLSGVLAEDADGMVWLQRVARCIKGQAYETQLGQLTLVVDGPGGVAPPVRHVRYWEHGPLELRGPPEAAGQPWTLIEVFAKRHLVATAPPENPEAQRVAEWAIYRRQQAGADLITRYGIRTNGGQVEPLAHRFVGGGPTESNTFYFVATAADAATLLAWLVSKGQHRLDPWPVVTVVLPRYAHGWRLMDDVWLESQAFPMRGDHALIGEVHWAGTDWTDLSQWYAARVGRFSVRGVDITPAHGPRFPVRVLAQLQEWL